MLMLWNAVKEEEQIPNFIRHATIAIIPKKGKKTKTDPSCERGIFLVSTLRSISLRLAYNAKKEMIDS